MYIRYTRYCVFIYYYPIKQKKRWYRALLCLSWCRRRDLNSHAIARTAAWRQRVCRSTTPACFMMLNYNTLKKMICLPLNGKKSFFYLTFPAMIANAGRYPMCAWQDIYFSKQKKDADIERLTQQMVQEKRFELSRDCSHCRLKTACLPFHHSCMIECPTIIH